MCGIFGFYAFSVPLNRSQVIELLFTGLRRLEYRGYDSAGISLQCEASTSSNGETQSPLVIKAKGNISVLESLTSQELVTQDVDTQSRLVAHVGAHCPPLLVAGLCLACIQPRQFAQTRAHAQRTCIGSAPLSHSNAALGLSSACTASAYQCTNSPTTVSASAPTGIIAHPPNQLSSPAQPPSILCMQQSRTRAGPLTASQAPVTPTPLAPAPQTISPSFTTASSPTLASCGASWRKRAARLTRTPTQRSSRSSVRSSMPTPTPSPRFRSW